MIPGGSLSDTDRRALIRVPRDGLEEHRVARRPNSIVLLDQDWSCERVGEALLLGDDTVRSWHRAFEQGGIEALKTSTTRAAAAGSPASRQSRWAIVSTPTALLAAYRKIGAWLKPFGLSYSRSGLIVGKAPLPQPSSRATSRLLILRVFNKRAASKRSRRAMRTNVPAWSGAGPRPLRRNA